MEHDFYGPGIDEVQDFADVILLFISYTDKYLFETKKECELIDDESQFYCIPEFDRDEQKIIVDVRGSPKERKLLHLKRVTRTWSCL